MRPELILWDWNGTLLDDVELCVDALNRLLEKHAYPQRYDRDQYRAIFGFPIEEYYVRAGFDFSRHSFAMLAEEYMDDYIPASAACPLAEGAIEALDAFRAEGLRQVILSASPVPTLTRQAVNEQIQQVAGIFLRVPRVEEHPAVLDKVERAQDQPSQKQPDRHQPGGVHVFAGEQVLSHAARNTPACRTTHRQAGTFYTVRHFTFPLL